MKAKVKKILNQFKELDILTVDKLTQGNGVVAYIFHFRKKKNSSIIAHYSLYKPHVYINYYPKAKKANQKNIELYENMMSAFIHMYKMRYKNVPNELFRKAFIYDEEK